jgi:integrase
VISKKPNAISSRKDLRRLPWTAYDGVTIGLRQSKGGKIIRVPVTQELKAHLDGLTRTGLLILTTPPGKAYSKRYFNEHWREDANLAGAGDLNFHDNRGTAATHLAEAGANAMMIASVMGWSIEKAQRIIETYIAKSSALAAAGIEMLETHRAKKAGTSAEQKL